MLSELQEKEADIDTFAVKALSEQPLIIELLDGLKVKTETYRYNCYKVLYSITQSNPEVLYPHWDGFVASLSSHNSYHKMSAVHLVANLTRIDEENLFEKIFDTFYDLLDDRSMVVAYYTASNSGKIAKAKPHLMRQITGRLIDIDSTHHETGRKELIKTGIIEAFTEYYEDSEDKDKILRFVGGQLNSESPKTRKTAKAFLEKYAPMR